MPTGNVKTAYEQGYATEIGANKTQCPTCTVTMTQARRSLSVNFIAKITAALKASATAKSAAIVASPSLLAAAINKAAVAAGIANFTAVDASQMTVFNASVVDDVTSTSSSSSSNTKLIVGLVVGIGGFVLLVAIGAAVYMYMGSGGAPASGQATSASDTAKPSAQMTPYSNDDAPAPVASQSHHDGGRACC
jgi:hypothetical protein